MSSIAALFVHSLLVEVERRHSDAVQAQEERGSVIDSLGRWLRLHRVRFARALKRSQRLRIMQGRLQTGDVVALRRFVRMTQAEFARALGISVHTLRNWEQGRRTPEGPALALLRIAARHPRLIRENLTPVA